MLRTINIALRDWWRGYTNDDLASAMRKMEVGEWVRPGKVITFSEAEHRAWRDISTGKALSSR